MREPTGDECNANTVVEIDGRPLVAAWYPQMGGYCGKCWIERDACSEGGPDPDNGFDVYVFHDGAWPFAADGRSPVHLHHCAPAQFVEFGQLVQRLQGGN